MHKKMFTLLSLFIVASMVLVACAPATPQTIVQTVQVEVVKTQIVEVAGTPMVITATPEPPAPEQPAEQLKEVSPQFKEPETLLIIDGAGEQETLDPAWTYETRGSAIEANIYEGLVFFNKESTSEFVPALATEWTTSPDGLTWTFNIRTGITFHEGGTLEPHDIAYTLWRNLLQGRIDGPQWIPYEGFFGSDFAVASSKDLAAALKGKDSFDALSPADLADVCEQVKSKIVADDAGGTVTFTLAQPMPWLLAVAAQPLMGGVLDQEWMTDQGDWGGDCANWQDFADPPAEKSILFNKANGTGPYKLDHWTPGEETVLVANDNYWRTEPMWDGAPTGAPQIKRVVLKNITEWGTRLSMLEAGDADWIYTPAQYRAQLYPYAKQTCYFDKPCEDTNPTGYLQIWRDLPQPANSPAQFNWQIDIEGGNPYVGSGALDGNGIPPNFFSDLHVRKAFSWCFDYEALVKDGLAGEAVQLQGPIIQGMMGYREGEPPLYSYDPAKCEEEFKAADVNGNGTPASGDPDDVWDKGFYMQIAYNQGNAQRQVTAEILKAGLESVNPKFSVQVLALPWPVLLEARRARKLPVYIGGWLEDFHDPHNWVQPFLSSTGAYGRVINMTDDYKAKYDAWIKEGVLEPDPAKRKPIYEQIQLASEEDAVVLWAYQVTWMSPWQEWIKGYYYNPAYPQSEYTWIYALSKVAP